MINKDIGENDEDIKVESQDEANKPNHKNENSVPTNLDEINSLPPRQHNSPSMKYERCLIVDFCIKMKSIIATLFVIFICILLTIYLACSCNFLNHTNISGYLVHSDVCKIPDISPYDRQMMKFFTKMEYAPCSNESPLTTVEFDEEQQLYVLKLTNKIGLNCYYNSIERNLNAIRPDDSITMGPSISFEKTIVIPSTIHSIYVYCEDSGKTKYQNVHAMIPKTKEIRNRLDNWKLNDTKQPISVLLLGIDSISRLHLKRAMPITESYLHKNNWFELSGYNKIDDNTLPNLMALLTGYNRESYTSECSPHERYGIERCPFIWNLYRNNGYVTAYAEDWTYINTFNLGRIGFMEQPVDYYIRPLMLVADNKMERVSSCVGLNHAVDYIFEYAIELGTRYKGDPYFGLFWTTSFSHYDFSEPSSMDTKILGYIKKLETQEILDQSIVIFFSDHGIRFGSSRRFYSGHLEERLPFMFIWLPTWFKNDHPEYVNALKINNNRLTNPYDIHMTLKHIMELSNRTSNQPKAKDCPKCQTVLQPIPNNRSCDDVAINDHWCTCIPFNELFENTPIIERMGQFAINHMNNYTRSFKNGIGQPLCYELDLFKIIRASKSIGVKLNMYRIVFEVSHGNSEFEATIQHNEKTDTFDLIGIISRIDSYSQTSFCVSYEQWDLKLYCHCANSE